MGPPLSCTFHSGPPLLQTLPLFLQHIPNFFASPLRLARPRDFWDPSWIANSVRSDSVLWIRIPLSSRRHLIFHRIPLCFPSRSCRGPRLGLSRPPRSAFSPYLLSPRPDQQNCDETEDTLCLTFSRTRYTSRHYRRTLSDQPTDPADTTKHIDLAALLRPSVASQAAHPERPPWMTLSLSTPVFATSTARIQSRRVARPACPSDRTDKLLAPSLRQSAAARILSRL